MTDEQIRNEAAEWFLAMREGELDGAALESFDRWLKLSANHVQAYLRISAVWQGADALKLSPRWSMPRWRPAALAASLILGAAAAGIAWFWPAHQESYRTLAAERRTIDLPDGSRIELNARSEIKLRFNASERGVQLVDGQALFSVAKDASRPFVVLVGESRFQAVGTRFDLYRKPAQATLTVLEGQVAVDDEQQARLLVHAGEQARIGAGTPRVAYSTNVAAATSWTEGTLTFAGVGLGDVVEEYNRTGLRQIIIVGPDMLKYHISGVFPATDPEPLVKFLQQRFAVGVEEKAGTIRIFPPRKE